MDGDRSCSLILVTLLLSHMGVMAQPSGPMFGLSNPNALSNLGASSPSSGGSPQAGFIPVVVNGGNGSPVGSNPSFGVPAQPSPAGQPQISGNPSFGPPPQPPATLVNQLGPAQTNPTWGQPQSPQPATWSQPQPQTSWLQSQNQQAVQQTAWSQPQPQQQGLLQQPPQMTWPQSSPVQQVQQQTLLPQFQQQPQLLNQPQSQNLQQPNRTPVDILSGATADFLVGLNKDQLIAFLRVYFMSRLMGLSVLDPRSDAGRSANPSDQRAIETARSIPLSEVQLAQLEKTGLGKLLGNYAQKLNSVPSTERAAVIKDYYDTVEKLKIPKGIKYALKHVL